MEHCGQEMQVIQSCHGGIWMVSKLWCQACNEVVDLERNEQGRETDPHGTDAHSPGAKLDAGKNRLGLVLGAFAGALTEVGKVGTYGANKYTDNGWLSVPDGHARYTDAMYRHLLSEAKGEEYDPDTGIRHAAHAAWNALARLELALREVRGQ